ncbi:MAG: Sua5/YciO/YrdC/YwlC family protein [Deferribacteraceae bacterium]|jgi:L-threonylcarbamoyladenylate synthase|nr:Sua5/YciO/YrdC/YwlC family protein [Deferribacteraceae bacterium]
MLVLPADFNNAFFLFQAALADSVPVIFPTDTIYGIGAPISSIKANEKIFEIKKREAGKPLPILVGSKKQLAEIAVADENFDYIPEKRNKGGITHIFRASPLLPEIYKKDGSVAVRLVKKGWLGKLLLIIGAVTATSVNISDTPPLLKPDEIYAAFKGFALYMLWGEAGGSPSEIVGLNGEKIR